MIYILQQIELARSGDDHSFIQLFQLYEKDIYRTVYIYVNNEQDAFDLVQETAYRAFKAMKGLQQPQYFKTWLIKIAINCTLDFLRKSKKLTQRSIKELEYIQERFEDNFEEIDLQVTLQQLMELLDPQEKSVIILRFYHDLTLHEIASTLSIPQGTAKTIYYRAVHKLREKIKRGDLDE